MMRSRILLSSLWLLLVLPLAVSAADKGWFGLGLNTEVDGSFWNPVLSSASVSQVATGSPTEKVGITVGDLLLEIEGVAVPGAKGEQLKKIRAVLEKTPVPEDKLHLRLRRLNGETYSVVLTAAPHP